MGLRMGWVLFRRAGALAILLLCTSGSRVASDDTEARGPGLSLLPLDFVENRGQWKTPAQFVAHKGALAAALHGNGIEILHGDRRLRLTFEGASPRPALVGENRRAGRYNFFFGKDPAGWRSNVAAYESVVYRGLYEDVDLRVREEAGRLEYDLILAPGADLGRVVVRAAGASALELAADGSLSVRTADGTLRQTPPRTWEVLPDGRKRPLSSRFRVIDSERYGFETAARDETLALVVDPGLEWSTFLGGFDREEIHGLAVATDGTGDVIVAGSTWSADFPATSGSRGVSPLAPFVARLTSNGSSLVYATLFGGNDGNVSFGLDLALDASSAPVVVGETNSATFPTTPGAFDPTFNEPSAQINRGWDAFVTRFDAGGSRMVFSTYLGASPTFDPNQVGSKRGGDESARAVTVDASGSVIVAGATDSDNFPTTAGAYDRTHEYLEVQVTVGANAGTAIADTDSFIARLDPTGAQLTYSTFLGGQADDVVRDLVVDPQGFVTVVGVQAPIETSGSGPGGRTQHGTPFPTTPDAVTRTHLGASDVILARLKLDGSGAADLKYATIFGGFYIDEGSGIVLDPGNPELVTICGWNRSHDFPTTPGAWRRAPLFLADGSPYYSGFVSRFRFPAAGGGAMVWSTLIEGSLGAQIAERVAIDPSGDVIVIGTDEGGLPTTDRSWRRAPSGGPWVYRLSGDGRQLLYGTLLHSPSTLFHDMLHVVSAGPGIVLVAGNTLRTDFPTTPGAFDRLFGSDGTSDNFHRYDAFVAKLSLEPLATADTAAAAPALIFPADGASLPAGVDIPFDWSDVADPSGVRFYELAVSSNPDFVTGFGYFWLPNFGFFTESQYTAPEHGTGVYYWRVRTLDNANNFSPWSATRRILLGDTSWTNFAAVSLTPNGVVGGSTIQGKLFVQNFAPAGGIAYTLTSSNTAAATVPASVTVPAGANSATFTVTTKAVSKSTPVQLTVWAEGNGDHPVLWVDPAPAGAVMLSAISLNPTSLTGGASSQGTVALNAAAPAGGASVALSSSHPSVATVPASVTVTSGTTTASFTVTTSSVSSSTSVTITGSQGGASRAMTLTVAPPAAPAAPVLVSPANDARPAQPVLFDWSDVSGAASYTIQLDDSSTFSSPLVASANPTASQAAIGGLPAIRLWWRVRALNSAGTPGVWSTVRRVEPQTAPAASPTPTPTRTPTPALTATRTPTRTPTPASTAATATRTPTPPPPTPTRTPTASTAPLPAPSLLSPGSDARFSPGTNILFDWSDVAGATSYTLQVDDDDQFPSPLLLSQTTTASQLSTSSLPTRTMWFRVRAVSSSGSPGNWSQIRRFEVKD